MLDSATRCDAGVRGERRQQCAGHRDDRLEVHRDHGVELLGVHLFEPAGERDPGVVDQQGGLRVGRGDRRPGGDGGRGVREVGDVLGDPHPARHRPGGGGDRGEAVGVAVQEHEVTAPGGEPGGQGRADPARGAGDHRGAALERVPAHHAAPWVLS